VANAIYPKFKEHLLNGEIDLGTATIKAYLVDTADYTYSAAHDAATDLTSGTGDVASVTLGTPTIADENVDIANFTFSAVTGDVSEAIIITATDTGATERLVAYYDTGVTGLPVTPNGGDIDVTVNASGLFDL
jgi:hypothetical protein